jgi:ribosomal protein S27E
VSGRISVHLDQGLGWTKPLVVACCRDCGTELARSTSQTVAERTARRTRCPSCGTRAARRLPGTTSLAADVAVAGVGGSSPTAAAGRLTANSPPTPNALEGGESPACPHPGPG